MKMNLKKTNNFKIKSLGVKEINVYDIEVEDNHNFFANDILVHNSAYIQLNQLVTKIKEKNPDITQNEIVDKIDSFMNKVVLPIVKNGYDELAEYMNVNENRMFMAREKIMTKAMWVGRKKYAMLVCDDEGVRYTEPKLKVKGIEIVRSSTPKVIRESLKKALKYLLSDKDKFYKFVENYKKEFNKFEIEEIAFPRSVNNMGKYIDGNSYKKGTPIALRAAFAYNRFINKYNLISSFAEIQTGEKIKFIYMKMPNPVYENVFGFIKRFPKETKNLATYVDYDTQYEKVFMSVINKICDHIGIESSINHESINDLF